MLSAVRRRANQARAKTPAMIPPTTSTTTTGSSEGDFPLATGTAAACDPPPDLPLTRIVAFIHGCGVQMSAYDPGFDRTTIADRLCLIRPVSNAPVFEVAVCEISPVFVNDDLLADLRADQLGRVAPLEHRLRLDDVDLHRARDVRARAEGLVRLRDVVGAVHASAAARPAPTTAVSPGTTRRMTPSPKLDSLPKSEM